MVKEKYLIVLMSLLTELVDFKISIWSDKQTVTNVVSKINLVYKMQEKREKSTTDYLFNGVERSNLDKTLDRLERMNKLMGMG